MNKKAVIVTGASGKIGYSIARNLASKPEYKLTLVGRDENALKRSCNELVNRTGNQDVEYLLADLSLKDDINALRSLWNGPLDILINNAASCPRSRIENSEGIEMQFATNVLGYFRMIKAFEPILKASAPSRVINVASYWAGDLDMMDLEFKLRKYDNNTAYRQSKQAVRMLTAAFAEQYDPVNITVNACHPGDVNSKLSNSLGFGGHESPDQGAETPVWLATSTEVEGISGKYFEHQHEQYCRFAVDKAACDALFEICENY